MTLTELLKPTALVTLHAQAKGAQLGAGAGVLASLPCLTLASQRFNASNDPPLVAVAKLAGIGAASGVGLVTVLAIGRLATVDAEGIHQRARKLRENDGLRRARNASTLGAAVGVVVAGARVVNIANEARVSVPDVALSREAAWEAFCFCALGAFVGMALDGAVRKVVGTEEVPKDGVEKMKEIDEDKQV